MSTDPAGEDEDGGVRAFARDHTVGVAGTVSTAAVALVFAVALGFVPASLLPRAPAAVLHAIPTVNAAASVVAIGTIAGGVAAARRGDYQRHRRLMGASTALFATFLVLYLYRVAVVGTTPFPGPQSLYTTVYLPLLAVHVSLAVVCVPLVVYALTLATTRPVSALAETPHARVGRVAAVLWVVSFALGVVVYLLLYVVF
ncbi:DUF420 domain-containing protein [Halobaculum sp. P14]|uniref:DUF420 domain-containing protein n=1 Tax=Halobaculum sp. P14 TaxID=3421638 RepID=UPI003EBD138A